MFLSVKHAPIVHLSIVYQSVALSSKFKKENEIKSIDKFSSLSYFFSPNNFNLKG